MAWWDQRKLVPAFVALSLVAAAAVRLSAYAAPIRAADIVQDRNAVEFVARDGMALGTILARDQEHAVSVPLDDVAPTFVHAIVAAEDARFFERGPVDYRALARAAWEAASARSFRSGGSTICMQLARMLRPLPGGVTGKATQIYVAWRVAAGMSRDEILAAYVNRLPMGGNLYGVEAAARTFFGVPAADLTLAQASLLAALPNDPVRLDPFAHWRALKNRQRYVLYRMAEEGWISRGEAERAFVEHVSLQQRNHGIFAAPHLLFWLARSLPPNTAHVRTTIDLPLQRFVESQVRHVLGALAGRDAHHAAVLVVDNATGEVLAYVGSPDYFDVSRLGRNDGVQALRQPGSTLKPFLYELALERRAIRPTTILADTPAHYAIPNGMLYSPTDYSGSFQGPVRVRFALANSLNVPAVRVLSRIGVPAFLDRLRELGFEHLSHDPDYYGLGLTLGGGEVSLWELTRAYVALARGGNAIALHADASAPAPSPTPIGEPDAWALVTDMIADNNARALAFGTDSVLTMPFEAAAKTGTSSDFRDTWTVGGSTRYTVGVWVGNFDGSPMHDIAGVSGAGPLWNRVMLHLHEDVDPADFRKPASMVRLPICATTGERPSARCPSAIVQEYLFADDLAAYRSAGGALASDPAYDEWLARQPDQRLREAGFRIVAPHDGDTFALLPARRGDASQRLAFRVASAPRGGVRWRLNGVPVSTRYADRVYWPLRSGRFVLEASAGAERAIVHFEVIKGDPPHGKRGFSVAGR